MFTSYAKKRAILATVGFSVFGLASFFFINDWYSALPLVIFYTILVVNTYFSIRCFASITPQNDRLQQIMDVVLAFLIFAQAASSNSPFLFVFFATLLFALAILKYVLLYADSRHQTLLKRKIKINTLGAVACIITLWGIFAGFTFVATYLLAASFLIVNLYLFFIKPLYVLTSD